MIEENDDLHKPKPKLSKFAVVVLIISCISIIVPIFSVLVSLNYKNSEILWVSLYFANFINFTFSGLSLLLGVLTIISISGTRGLQKGYTFVILGILLSAIAFINTPLTIIMMDRTAGPIVSCQNHMTELYKLIAAYSKIDGQYPLAEKWCDMLGEKPISDGWFLCTKSPKINIEPPYYCSYAINPKAEPNSPGDVVLLFETKDGWNQFGGPELMSFDNHYRKGCNVLFNDGHTEFIKPKNKDKLNWGRPKP